MRSAIHKQNSPMSRTSLIARYCVAAVVLLALFLVLGVAPLSASLFPEYRITYSYERGGAARPKISGHIVVWLGSAYGSEERNRGRASAADVSNIEQPVFLFDVPNLSEYGAVDDFDFEGNILTWAPSTNMCLYEQWIHIYDLANPLAKDNYPASPEAWGCQPATNGSEVIYVGTGMQYVPRGNSIERWTIRIYVPHWRATTSLIDEIHERCQRGYLYPNCPQDPPGPICIDGDTIVWSEYSTGKIWGFDVFERKHFAISYGIPRGISGDLVLIVKLVDTTTAVMSYVDISDRDNPIEFAIATFVGLANLSHFMQNFQPRIDGNIVVWDDERNGNSDIYGYDITSGTEFQITDDTAPQMVPDISGHTVVWSDYRHSPAEIYAANIAPVCLAAVQGDLNGDCKVDFSDFVLFTQNWLQCNFDPPSACWE